jgi:hypothetical protein
MKFFRDLFTERNNETYDLVRVLATLGFFMFVFLCVYEMINHCHDFQLFEASGGMAAILAAIGGSVGYKARSEGEPNESDYPPKD